MTSFEPQTSPGAIFQADLWSDPDLVSSLDVQETSAEAQADYSLAFQNLEGRNMEVMASMSGDASFWRHVPRLQHPAYGHIVCGCHMQ